MHRQRFAVAAIVAIGIIGGVLISRPNAPATVEISEAARGPHGGRLLADGEFALEVTIFETGVAPQFRLYPLLRGRPLRPLGVEAEIELARLGGRIDRFTFQPEGDYLFSPRVVEEPHSFDVTVRAHHEGRTHEWQYESHEGRTQIGAAAAARAGLETATAGPALIRESSTLHGSVVAAPDRVRRVQARFPSVVRTVRARVGEQVRRGATLAVLESNESLQTYPLSAPIDGVVVERNANPGDVVDEQETLFTVSDLSRVWVELAVFRRELPRVRVGRRVRIVGSDGATIDSEVAFVSPIGMPGAQAVTARVEIPNADGRWQPGAFVTAEVVTAETQVPLAVRRSALQRFRDFDAVFAQFGDTYEVRMLELGRRDSELVEVKSGLEPGTRYVTQGSYLVKADIEKSGAGHDH